MLAACYRSPMQLRLIIVPALLLLASCSAAPRVALTGDAVVTEQSAAATAGVIRLHVENPNNTPIKLVKFDYTATIPGHASWTGRHSGGMVLAPGFARTAELPIVLPAGSGAGTRVRIKGSLHFLDSSTIAQTMAEWGYRPSTSFSGAATMQASPENVVEADGPTIQLDK
jgi:hypothetical protein